MKRLALIVLICFVAILAFANQENNDTTVENAATHYLKTFELLKYPKSKEIGENLGKAIKNGWQKESQALEEILNKNEPTFVELEKALLIENCDFTFGKEYKYSAYKELPDLIEVKNLFNLLLLKGRYYENQNNTSKAIDTYLSALILAQQISQSDDLISKLVALTLEDRVYVLLGDYCIVREINLAEQEKISAFLEKYKKVHFLASELIECEKIFFISTMQILVDDIQEQAVEENLNNNNDKIKSLETFRNQFMKQANGLTNKYYGNFAKAVETNKEEDWSFATNQLEAFRKETNSTVEMIKDVGGILYKSITKDIKGYNQAVTKKVVSIALSTAMPDFKKATELYYLTLKKLNLLLK